MAFQGKQNALYFQLLSQQFLIHTMMAPIRWHAQQQLVIDDYFFN